MSTAIYLRVSSKSQDHRGQEAELKRWATAQDGQARWFRDSFTGKSMERPGWQKLWAGLEAGEIKKIVVWRLDRLGRTVKGLTALFDDLGQRRIGLVSLKDGLDLSTPAGRRMANVLASVAAYETEVRSERQRAGIDAVLSDPKQRASKYAGRKPGSTTADPQRARELRKAGLTQVKIAATLGVSRETVIRYLRA